MVSAPSDHGLPPNPVQPQWEPPSHLRDPLVNTATNVDRALWTRLIKRRLPRLSDYAVAYCMADHGNKDGTSIFPGVELVAEELGTTTKTVKTSLAWLTEHGWLFLEKRGNRRIGHANRYRLSAPAPLASTVAASIPKKDRQEGGPTHRWLWSEDAPQWIERPASEPKREAARGQYERATGPSKAPRGATIRGSNNGLGEVTAPHQGVITSPHQEMYQGSINHHPESNSRGHAAARPRQKVYLDRDAWDYREQLVAYIEGELGGPMHPTIQAAVDSMADEYAHPRMIVNYALKREQEIA